jgi:formamidopyrimidine-DNA glycosylase
MPELPEVQTVVDEMHRRIAGDTIVEALLTRPDYVRTATPNIADLLRGRRVLSVSREGKRIWLDLSAPGARPRDTAVDARCRMHLGMSGRITFEPVAADVEPHTHLRLRFRRLKKELRFRDPRRFGGIWFYNGSAEAGAGASGSDTQTTAIGSSSGTHASPLGVDALAVSAGELRELCRRRRPIKSLLLDQSLISGLGNIYCDEALFDARIHPLRPAGDLDADAIRRLARGIRAVLRRAIHHGGSTLRDYVRADGRAGEFQSLHCVYDRKGEPCTRCRRTIERIVLSARSTHFCPRCQALTP